MFDLNLILGNTQQKQEGAENTTPSVSSNEPTSPSNPVNDVTPPLTENVQFEAENRDLDVTEKSIEKTTEKVVEEVAKEVDVEKPKVEQDPSDIFGALSLQASKEDEKAVAKEKGGIHDVKKAATSTTKKADNKNEDFSNVNIDTVIRIGREQISILDFFTIEEINMGIPKKVKKGEEPAYRSITGEDVRARLEKNGFVEFVKDYTKMVYLEGEGRNFILPMTIAKVKGNSATESPSLLESLNMRIPYELYEHFLTVAYRFARFNLEVRGEFYFNYDSNQFYLYYPSQCVHEMWVDVLEAEETFVKYMLEERGEYCELVCEIHSHHLFAPHPSPTDNKSERRPRMTYAIVGHVTAPNKAAFTARKFNLNETYTQLNLDDIFGYSTETDVSEEENIIICFDKFIYNFNEKNSYKY